MEGPFQSNGPHSRKANRDQPFTCGANKGRVYTFYKTAGAATPAALLQRKNLQLREASPLGRLALAEKFEDAMNMLEVLEEIAV